jgi:hypothetical protein
MRELISGIRRDAAEIRIQARHSKGLGPEARMEIATRLDRIDMRLDELAAFTLAG